tara:strand:+ start:7679 stop:8104 length:426 start_codon:yes stop_codon:yes gene_type:complete
MEAERIENQKQSIDKGILILPTILPLTLDTSIKVIKNLQELNDFGGIALQLNLFNQDLLSKTYNERSKVSLEEIGYFYPIVNFATYRCRPTYAVGEEDFKDMNEAVEIYRSISDIHNSIGDTVYVCSRENANFFKNIIVID